MIRLATCAALLLLGGCAHVVRDLDQDGREKKPATHVTLVLCLFASCHDIAPPEGPARDCPKPQ